MNRSALALTIVALFCSGSLAQERETRARDGQRREYVRSRVGVEDPAGFRTELKQVFSGPQPGEKLPAFKAVSLVGDGTGLDLVTSAGDQRHVLLFQDASRSAIVGLFNAMNAIGKISRKTDKDLQVACVFLVDDAELIPKGFAQLEHAQGFPELRKLGVDVIAVSKDGRDGPGGYGLNRKISQTIILARNGKVTRNFIFDQGMLSTDPHVLGGIAELLDEDRETVAGWLAETNEEAAPMRMRRDKDPRAAAKAALRRKAAEFVRAGKLTREEAREIYQLAFPERR